MHIRASVLLMDNVLADEDFSHHDLIRGRIITWAANEPHVKAVSENNETLWLEIEITVHPEGPRIHLPRIRL